MLVVPIDDEPAGITALAVEKAGVVAAPEESVEAPGVFGVKACLAVAAAEVAASAVPAIAALMLAGSMNPLFAGGGPDDSFV